jgi:tetratricopeptide (TPR) repeat protein
MRLVPSFLLALGVAACQTDPAPQPQTPSASAPVVTVSVPPLGPVDLDTPYASPRDAARHWLQTTLANLRQQRNLAAIRGTAQALVHDRSYAFAAFDLGILAAIAEKWDDAAAAFDEAARLDPAAFAAPAKPQAERARLLATLEKTPEGRRKPRYDEAMSELLPLLPKMSSEDALTALAELGRIDPRRWEAPALLAGLVGDGSGYPVAARFLEIAIRNAANSPGKLKLEQAKRAAEIEVSYESARLNAAVAAENGKYAEAAGHYETAWKAVPARLVNGMDAASADLLADDTAHASVLLARLRGSGDPEFSTLAASMLKEFEPVEPAAKSTASDSGEFFKDAGSRQPPRIADLLPPIDRTDLIYSQPLPKLVDDPAPVVLLASLSADSTTAAATPVLPPPTILGEHPWAEIASRAPASSSPSAAPIGPLQTAVWPAAPPCIAPSTLSAAPPALACSSAKAPTPHTKLPATFWSRAAPIICASPSRDTRMIAKASPCAARTRS